MKSRFVTNWSQRLVLLVYLLFDLFFHICLANYIAVVGSKIGLGCNTTLWGEDIVSLILWYKGSGTGAPLYTVDARSFPLALSKHSPSDQRYTMDVNVLPPVLYINPVTEDDEGEYRCRVDYRSDRTQNFVVDLKVIVPPKNVIVMDAKGQTLDAFVGPYNEGYHFVAICQSEGGRPMPTLQWFLNGNPVVSSYSSKAMDILETRYEIRHLNRSNLLDQLECKVSITNGTVLRSKSLTIDMNLRPLEVRIVRLTEALSSGSKAELECLTYGSKPAASISWWKGTKRMDNVLNSISSDGNVTKSTLIFIPTTEDNGKHVSCRAINTNLNNYAIEDGIILNVHYVPQLTVNLGATIKRDSIKEGNDVILECSVKANPKVEEIVWTFDGKPLKSNSSHGVLVSNQSLVLRSVRRQHRGNYRCLATNKEGQTKSDPFTLRVKYPPTCKHGQKSVYATARNEIVHVACHVDSDPFDVHFKWSMNTSSQNIEVRSYTSNGTQSVATYVPSNRFGYGLMLCYAENEIGKLKEPCTFSIIPAGPPERVSNCKITNHSMSTLFVDCTPGDSHGLRQKFVLEVYNTLLNTIAGNYSNTVKPLFLVNNLPAGTSFTLVVYAVNTKGKSSPVSLVTSTLAEPEKQMSHESIDQLTLNPLLIILIAFVGVMVVISITVVIIIRIRSDRYDNINGEVHSRNRSDGKYERRQRETNGFNVFKSRDAKNDGSSLAQQTDSSMFELMESKRFASRNLSENQYIFSQQATENMSLQHTPNTDLSNDISLDDYIADRRILVNSPNDMCDFGDNSQSRRRVAFISDTQLYLPERESLAADGCSDRETPIESSAMNNLRISCEGNEVTICFQLPKDQLMPLIPRTGNRATPV